MNLHSFSDEARGTWSTYLGISIPLIFVTGWLMLALQRHQREPERSFMLHLLWPFRDLRRALKLLWEPVNVPIKRRVLRAKEALSAQQRSRPRGWSRVHRQFPVVHDHDHAYEGSQGRATTPLVDVVKAVTRRERMNGSAV